MEAGVFESQVRNATARLVAVVWIANTMRRLQCCDVDCWCVDEAHVYRSVFGSHVACVFRRLFRLCALYGSNVLADGRSASR